MPIYLFQHPKTKEVREVIFGMKEEKKFVLDGVEWKRLFTVPQAAVDTKQDVFNPKDFVSKTAKQKGSYGDLVDQSKEASEKRKQKLGYDPVRKKYFEEWSKKRRGKKHPLASSEGF